MKPNPFNEITLSTLANNAVEDLFKHELNNVLKNINDINTASGATREITIKLKLKPNSDRDAADVDVQVTSKLAPIKGVGSSVNFVNDKGKMTAYQRKQEENLELFPMEVEND